MGSKQRSGVAVLLGAVLVVCACGAAEENVRDEAPATGAVLTAPGSGLTEAGHYRLSLRPRDREIPLGRLHAWVVTTETPQGQRFAPSHLWMGGGMPQHAHGFTTEPRVTGAMGEGEFLVEGVRFHMSGDWVLRIELVGPAGPDAAEFHVQVGP